MTDRVTRRETLAAVGLAGVAVAGCLADSNTSISVRSLDVSEINSGYEIRVETEVGVSGDWEPIRNVSVVVQNEQGTVVCRRNIGTINTSGSLGETTMTCESFPHTITYEMDRDPCSESILVKKMVYQDDTDSWAPENVEC
jgi:hypothetical protein